jgi:hypothetical protein
MIKEVVVGVLLFAAPQLHCQTPPTAPLQITEILRFTLDETPEQLRRGLGQPVMINDQEKAFHTWYYQTDVKDIHEHSHVMLLRRPDNKLLSVTRNYHYPVNVDALFPAGKSTIHHWPDDQHPQLSVQVRTYEGDRVLIAMGVAKPGQATTQLIMIRRSVLPTFFPWLKLGS